MAVADGVKPSPIPEVQAGVEIVDPKTGLPTLQFLQIMQKWRAVNLGGNRLIPCDATNVLNHIVLTPFDASPLLEGYRVYDRFTAFASSDCTGAVTATVVPLKGSLPTLKVYKSGGLAQASIGDVLQGALYDFIYDARLDSNVGGFVLK